MNPFRAILYQLYLLQLEEYNLERFQKVVENTHGTPIKEQRKSIHWTPKATAIFLLALIYHIVPPVFLAVYVHPAFLVFFLVFIILKYHPFYTYLILAVRTLQPLDILLKDRIIAKATDIISKYTKLKIIGIAGSFGKTTMKEVVSAVLAEKYKALKTPENINTPMGISNQIIKELDYDTEVYIVEMGEYYRGDIAAICQITKPDVGIVTGINEAHLEKMGSLNTTVETVFEIAEHMRAEGILVVNIDSDLVQKNYMKYVHNRRVYPYSSSSHDKVTVANLTLDEEEPSLSFTLKIEGRDFGIIKTPILGEYIVGDIVAAARIGLSYGMTVEEIKRGVAKLKPVSHRLEPIWNRNTNVLVIDDSYNGNPDGVMEAISLLAKFNRRKVYVTPGLVESAQRGAEIHYNIGKQLTKVADVVILIKNSVTPHIERGLKENGFKGDIVWFNSAPEAHKGLKDIIKSGDVVLFQNDWPDNYT